MKIPSNHSPSKLNFSLLCLQALAVMVLWVILAWNNRLVHDDLTLLKIVHEQGVVGGMQHFWQHWNTRWAALLWVNCWYAQWTYTSPPLMYHLLSFLFMCGSFMMLLKSLEKRSLIGSLSFAERIAFSVISFSGLIAASYSLADTWFWVNTSAMYGWNLGCMLYALAILLRERKAIDFLLLPLLGLYIGGAGELTAVVIIAGSLFLFSGVLTIKQKPTLRNIIFTGSVACGFAIAYAGAGHAIRSAALPEVGLMQVLLRGVYFTLKISFFHSPLRVIAILLLLLPLLSLAKPAKSKLSWKLFLKNEALPLMLYWIVIVSIHTLIITKLMGDYGPARAWSEISLITMLMMAWLLIKAGSYSLMRFSIKPIMTVICIALIALCVQQFIVSSNYSKAVDQRMNVFIKVDPENSTDTLYFDAIAPVYFLHSIDPGFADNSAWIGIKNPIIIKKGMNK